MGRPCTPFKRNLISIHGVRKTHNVAEPLRDFFVTYNHRDERWAEWIAWQLEAAGYTVFIQAWDFRPGSNFVVEMQNAATSAERTIVVLSPNYLAAEFTQPEWAAAFRLDPTGIKRKLVVYRGVAEQ